MKAPFEKTLVVEEADLDELQHVNNVRYVQWIQDISKEHWDNKVAKGFLEKVVWVVLKHTIHYKGAAKLGDTIILKTWVQNTKGATSTRIVEMYHKQDKSLLVHSETAWCLLDAKTLKPTRISKEIKDIFAD